jgi:hypothetical protein
MNDQKTEERQRMLEVSWRESGQSEDWAPQSPTEKASDPDRRLYTSRARLADPKQHPPDRSPNRVLMITLLFWWRLFRTFFSVFMISACLALLSPFAYQLLSLCSSYADQLCSLTVFFDLFFVFIPRDSPSSDFDNS